VGEVTEDRAPVEAVEAADAASSGQRPAPGSQRYRPRRPERSGSADVALRSSANGFLVAFALDAIFVLACSLLVDAGSPGASWLASSRVVFTGVLTVASLPLFVLMGINPALRWRIFLPPCLFLSWVSLAAMPLPVWFDAPEAMRVAGAIEAVPAALAFAFARQANGGVGWLLSDDALQGGGFSGRTAVRFTALNLLVILPASLLYLALAAASGVGHLSGGFVEIRLDGIHLLHREYQRGDQVIHLVSMMHIGDAAFYQDLLDSLPREGSITLAEGVSDETGRLSKGFSYGNVAAGLGLTEQPDFATGDRQVRYADVDVSSFSPDTLRFLSGVGRVFGAPNLSEALIAYVELSDMDSAMAKRTLTSLRHDLIEQRNEHLLSELEQALADYDVIVVPWGALHLSGIETGVRALGFTQRRDLDRRVVGW
jgi:hypothetical protein